MSERIAQVTAMKKIRTSARGFTLIELMITTVIIGIVAVLAVPRFQNAWERQKFRQGNGDLVSKIKLARSNAISSKQPYGIHFDECGLTYTVFKDVVNVGGFSFDDGDSVVTQDTLPDEFEYVYADCEGSVVMFNSNGSASYDGGGYIYTSGYTDQVCSMSMISILPATGKVSSESYYY